MEERTNKTIVCSVFFLDIIEYSKKSVAEQIALKERFNAFLALAISKVPLEDRIILDTGDGAAITFLGDVEDALQAALRMRESLLAESAMVGTPLLVRMGINLGPVRVVKDLNGRPNIVGDGINVAQRVMAFADAGQILVSRSYYDAVSRISEEFSGLFHYQGAKTDKHVREHEVYAIGYPGEMTGAAPVVKTRSGWAAGKAAFSAFSRQLAMVQRGLACRARELWQGAQTVFMKASGRQRVLYVGLMVAPLVVLLVFVARMSLQSDRAVPGIQEKPVASTLNGQMSASASSVVQQTLSAPEKVAVVDKTIASAKPVSEDRMPPVSEAKPSAKVAPQVKEKTEKTTDKANKAKYEKKSAGDAKAELILLIKPWGEVYVDGKSQGVSPPLSRLQLSPGKHQIAIRNANLPEFRRELDLRPGEEITLRHRFN